jgi:hypothetical protein
MQMQPAPAALVIEAKYKLKTRKVRFYRAVSWLTSPVVSMLTAAEERR